MDIYTGLKIATITLSALLALSVVMFVLWFKLEKKVAKYGKSLLYKTDRKGE